MNRIWERYFLLELIKVFLLFIFSFYFLYVLIDYSAHAKNFQGNIHFLKVVAYYLDQFTKRADILIPVALMIATIKVLTTLNIRNEIVAMAVSGVPIKRLMRPFLYAAAACTILLYLNFQYLQPQSLSRLSLFENTFFKAGTPKEEPVNSILLDDNSVLIYRNFDAAQEAFSDAYWVLGIDQIYRIKMLFPFTEVPIGNYVDELIRNESGALIRKSHYQKMDFPKMVFDTKTLFSVVHPPRWQSMTQLYKNLPWKKIGWGMGKMNDREAEAATFLFYKLSIPLLSLLAVLAPAPFCLRFTRNFSIFPIYALSLFGIITFFTLVNSSVILGESQVIPPFWAIWTPQAFFFLISGWNYAKL